MKLYKNVNSSKKPTPVWTDEYHVYTAANVKEKEEKINEEVVKKYEFDLTIYDKDEYIISEMQKNKQENQLAIAQLAMQMGGAQNG